MADDLAQDACTKAFKSFDQYEKDTNYKAWIFKILTNIWKDSIRKEARAPFNSWDEDEIEKATAHDRHEPAFECQNREFYNHAIEAIARLSPPVRVVVCFSLLDGLSYQEIADIANIPIGTVRSRLSRGRRQLQSELKAHRFVDDRKETVGYLVPKINLQKKTESNGNNIAKTEMLT